MQGSNRQTEMTESSRGNGVGGRKKGRSYQKAMENLMGEFHDIEMNITNLSQQLHALRGHTSKINRLQKRYSLWRWHRRSQWQWRWRWPFRLPLRRHRFLTLSKKKTLGKRKETDTQIPSHSRHGGPAESTGQENVEAVVESYHSETNHFLCNDSPKGQDQRGGSAHGMEPESPSKIQPHTSKEGHIDSPTLSNESRGSSWEFPCLEEGFRQEATARAGDSPNEPKEGGEHGQICPPNWESNSPTFPGRGGGYGQIIPPNHVSYNPTSPRRDGESGQITPPNRVSYSPTSPRNGGWFCQMTPPNPVSYSPTSPQRNGECNSVSPYSGISYTPEIPVSEYNSGSSSDKNDSNSSQDYNQAYYYSPSPPEISDILMDQIMEHLDRLRYGMYYRSKSDAMETEQGEDANGQTLHSASLKEPQEDSNHTKNSDPACSGDSVIIIEDSDEDVTDLNQANHTKYSDPAGSRDSVIVIEDANEEVTDLNQANHTKYSDPAESRDSVIIIEDSNEEVKELNQAEGSQVIESNDQAEGPHTTEDSDINQDSQFQEHGSQDWACLDPLPPGPNPLTWSVQDVIFFLLHSGSTTFKVLADVCELHEIDGLALLLLDYDVLTRHMGIKEGPALTLCNFIKSFRETFLK